MPSALPFAGFGAALVAFLWSGRVREFFAQQTVLAHDERWSTSLIESYGLGLKRFRHGSLESLVREHLAIREDEGTARLCKRFRVARRRGYLTKGEFVEACVWKSARPIKHVRSNSHHRVRAATTAVLATRDEAVRLGVLLRLKGVSVPMASAILMFLDPRRYGVIDIRAWQLLHAVGAVTENEKGTNFTPKHWLQFLGILRRLSSRLGVSARTIERTLFDVHKARQEGTLYEPRRGPAR